MVIWVIENNGQSRSGRVKQLKYHFTEPAEWSSEQPADFANGSEPNVACRVSHVPLLEFQHAAISGGDPNLSQSGGPRHPTETGFVASVVSTEADWKSGEMDLA
jgi:hypothetical protein